MHVGSVVPLFSNGVRGAGLSWMMEFRGPCDQGAGEGFRPRCHHHRGRCLLFMVWPQQRAPHVTDAPSFNTPLHFWKVLLREAHELRGVPQLCFSVRLSFSTFQPSTWLKEKLLCFQRKYV